MRHTSHAWTALVVSALAFGTTTAPLASAASLLPTGGVYQTGDYQVIMSDHVTGTLTYLPRIALPPEAQITVQLLDVSRADAPAIVLAQYDMLAGGKQVPFEFSLPFDAAAINPANSYVVRATITTGDRLLFTTTEAYSVITRGHSTVTNLVLTPVSGGNSEGQTTNRVSGTITYHESFVLPDEASLSIQLLDVTEPDSLATVISEVTIPTNGNQVPLTFNLPFDPSEIAPDRYYVVKVEISVGDTVLFATRPTPRVLTMGSPSHLNIVLMPPAGPPPAPISSLTDRPWVWVRSVLPDGTVHTPNQPGDTVLTFKPDGSIGLRTDCNSFFGQYELSGTSITFSQMGGTLMACSHESKQDAVVMGLQQATSYAITFNDTGSTLTLNLADGGKMTFRVG